MADAMNGNCQTAPEAAPPRAIVLDMSMHALADMLNLPPVAEVDAVQVSVEHPGVLRFRIRGFGNEVQPGQVIQRHAPQVRVMNLDGIEGDPQSPAGRYMQVQWPEAFYPPVPASLLGPVAAALFGADDDIPACPHCGAMAGACPAYPNCQGASSDPPAAG